MLLYLCVCVFAQEWQPSIYIIYIMIGGCIAECKNIVDDIIKTEFVSSIITEQVCGHSMELHRDDRC